MGFAIKKKKRKKHFLHINSTLLSIKKILIKIETWVELNSKKLIINFFDMQRIVLLILLKFVNNSS